MTTEKGLSVRETPGFLVKASLSELKALVQENYGDSNLTVSFDRVKMPTGGGLAYRVPSLTGGEDSATVLEGVILDHYRVRGYWPRDFAGGSPPQCSSLDGITGTGIPGGECSKCPFNAWESGKGGRGKACKEMQRVYLLRKQEVLPILISLPPTSLKPFEQYVNRLFRAGKTVRQVISQFRLAKDKNAQSIEYSRADVMASESTLTDAEMTFVKSMAEMMKPYIRQLPIAAEEYVDERPEEGEGGHSSQEEVEEGQVKEIQMRYLANGTPLTTFRLSRPDGQGEGLGTRCAAFGDLAEGMNDALRDEDYIRVEGHWTSKEGFGSEFRVARFERTRKEGPEASLAKDKDKEVAPAQVQSQPQSHLQAQASIQGVVTGHPVIRQRSDNTPVFMAVLHMRDGSTTPIFGVRDMAEIMAKAIHQGDTVTLTGIFGLGIDGAQEFQVNHIIEIQLAPDPALASASTQAKVSQPTTLCYIVRMLEDAQDRTVGAIGQTRIWGSAKVLDNDRQVKIWSEGPINDRLLSLAKKDATLEVFGEYRVLPGNVDDLRVTGVRGIEVSASLVATEEKAASGGGDLSLAFPEPAKGKKRPIDF